MLQIFSGTLRGRRLKQAKGASYRPTQGVVREALFNILGHSVEGCAFLDLFAGSGAMGLEALSRGADSVLFVERDSPSCRALRENIRDFSLRAHAQCVQADVFRFLERPTRTFDLIFADPPYADESESSYAQKLIDTPSLANWLAPEGSFWVEERSSVTLTLSDTSSLVCVDKRKYGSSALWHFRRK